jgi:hypothetical protein
VSVARYRSLADLPKRIPVFPLTGAIVLPRAMLPLNIFEPRYLAMVEAALRGDRVIGMIQPAPTTGEPTRESPESKSAELRRLGCAARLSAFQELDDGRMLISLRGIARFEVEAEVATPLPFRVLDVRFDRHASDLEADLGADAVDRERVLSVLARYLEQRRIRADLKGISQAPSELLVNSLSVLAPYGPEEKQALLEAPDLKSRAELLVALAEMDLRSGGAGSGPTLQ